MKIKTAVQTILFVLLFAVAGAAFYTVYLKVDVTEYITEKTDGFLYIKSERLSNFVNENAVEDKNLFKVEKVVKNIFALHIREDEDVNVDNYKYIVAVDTSYYFPVVMAYFTNYFKKDRYGIYHMKNTKNTPNNIRAIFDDMNVFIDRGIFFISKSEAALLNYREDIRSKGKKTVNPISDYYKKNSSAEIVFAVDAEKYLTEYKESGYIKNLWYLEGAGNINQAEDEFVMEVILTGDGKIFDLTSASKITKRKLGINISEGDIYIANNNLSELIKYIIKETGAKKRSDYFGIIEEAFGFSPEEMIDLAGNELVYNYRNNKISAVLLLKNEKKARNYFLDIKNIDGVYNFEGLKFIIEDGKIFAGDEISVLDTPKEIEEDTILYTEGELSAIYGLGDFRGVFAEVTLKNKEKMFLGEIVFEKNEFKKALKIVYGKSLEKIFN